MPDAPSAPLSDVVIEAVARLVDDSQSETREPSHSDLEYQIKRFGLSAGDPKSGGQLVGKRKRVRETLSFALEHEPDKGAKLVAALIAQMRGLGCFREASSNYIGAEPILAAAGAFRSEGYELSPDGELLPTALDSLSGTNLTQALAAYARRAQRGATDAALLSGTGKDLLEAVVKHVLVETGSPDRQTTFPALLGMGYGALGLATPAEKPVNGEAPMRPLERAMFAAACAVNQLRNREGTGHGRPWLPSLSDGEARAATQVAGVVAAYLLRKLEQRR